MSGADNPMLLQQQANQQEEAIMHQVENRPVAEATQEMTRHRHHLLEDHDTELHQLEERLERFIGNSLRNL
jgi:RNA polymerase II subunit A C-terminal domain phosphatase